MLVCFSEPLVLPRHDFLPREPHVCLEGDPGCFRELAVLACSRVHDRGLGWGLVHHDPARAARTQAAASESSFWLILKLLFLVIIPLGGRQAAASCWKSPSCRSEMGFQSGSEPGKPALPGAWAPCSGSTLGRVSSIPHRMRLQGPGGQEERYKHIYPSRKGYPL